MYRSGCTETVHIMSVQCTEVAHLYVPKWSYRSSPPHVPKWSCTELVLPRLFLPPPWSSGPTFEINLESHVTGYRHKVLGLGLGLGPHVLLLLLLLVYTAGHTSDVNARHGSNFRNPTQPIDELYSVTRHHNCNVTT